MLFRWGIFLEGYNNQIIEINKEMCSRFTEFCITEFQSVHNIDFTEADGPLKLENNTMPTTAGAEESSDELPFFMKSSQNISCLYQISFQKKYMNEHEAVFKREFRNYMEFGRNITPEAPQLFDKLFPKGLFEVGTPNSCFELLNSKASSLDEEMASLLINNLDDFQKLKQFLNITCNYCPEPIALELFHLAALTLKTYKTNSNCFLDSIDLTDLAIQIADHTKPLPLLSLSQMDLSKSSQRNQMREKYLTFVKIFSVTAMLVTAQYFENPFNSQDDIEGLKRPLSPCWLQSSSEEPQNYESAAQKKRKFSF